MSEGLEPLIEKVDLLLAEFDELVTSGPHFKIVHRFHEPGTRCLPGEQVGWALLMHRSQEHLLRLPISLLLLFDYFAKNRHRPQSATQIAAGMRADAFYAKHGSNVSIGVRQTRRISRTSVREYVKRLRRALQISFKEAGLRLDPYAVLVSEATESNEIHYRLRATVEWIHIDWTPSSGNAWGVAQSRQRLV
jgi:hypothetical protein